MAAFREIWRPPRVEARVLSYDRCIVSTHASEYWLHRKPTSWAVISGQPCRRPLGHYLGYLRGGSTSIIAEVSARSRMLHRRMSG
eukprot:445966-Amorphochlora_amoeboformis.AAC.2